MSFSDLILLLALIGCIAILYKKKQERKVSSGSSRFPSKQTPGKPVPKTKKQWG